MDLEDTEMQETKTTSPDISADDELKAPDVIRENTFEFVFDNIIELSQAAKVWLLKNFVTNFSYIMFFPMSEILRASWTRRFSVQALSWGTGAAATLFWVYFALFLEFRDRAPLIYDAELKIPVVLLVVLSVDTALSLSSEALKGKLKAADDFKAAYKRAEAKAQTGQKRHLSAYLRAMGQIVTIMPAEHEVREARRLLSSFNIVLPFSEEVTADVADQYTLLCYDQSLEKALGTSNNTSDSPDTPSSVDNFFSKENRQTTMEDVGLPSFDLGDSYLRQFKESRTVSLDALADQLIWGVREEVLGCNGVCERFWRIDKVPSVLTAIAMVSFFALLPTMFRAIDQQLDDFNRYEHLLSAMYFVLTISLSLQIGAFFVTIIEVYKTEWQRLALLTTLMKPVDAASYALPKLDFAKRDHIMAWLALRQYLSTFSHSTVTFFGQRLVIYSLGLMGTIAYLGTLYATDTLQSEGVFTSFAIIFFLASLVFFLMILAYGSLSNMNLTEHRLLIANKIMVLHERKFRLNRKGDEAIVEDDNIGFLYDLSNFLAQQPLVTLLGLELTPAVAGSLASVLVAVGGSIFPVLVNAFGGGVG